MKLKNTPEQLKGLLAAVVAVGGKPFQSESGDPKNNAQRNLNGRTHYVDDDTLRFHKSRVLSTAILANGLLFRITESASANWEGTSRGFRCVVFDVFGTVVSRAALEEMTKSSEAASKVSANEEIDLVAHYREAMISKLYWIKQDAQKVETALAMIGETSQASAA